MKDFNDVAKVKMGGGQAHPLKFPVACTMKIFRSLCNATIFGLCAILVVLSCMMYFDTGYLLGPLKLKAFVDYKSNTILEKLKFSPVNGSATPSPSLHYPAPWVAGSMENKTLGQDFTMGNESLTRNSSGENLASVDGLNTSGSVGIDETGQKKKEKKQLGDCDLSVGTWVWDESYSVYQSQNCPFIDAGFMCQENGRPDRDYLNWRWQPSECDLPRFDARRLIDRIRNRRVVFVGDSIGRNQWESMICMLAEAVPNKSRIYEINGNPITKHKGFLSFRFEDYNFTVEYYRSPFLVYQGRPPKISPPGVRMTLKIDVMDYTSHLWADGDILVFNTGHWWNYEKTIKGGCYFEEGGIVKMKMDIKTAFQRSMRTWVEWVHWHVNSEKTHIFLRSYAPVHFSNGDWNTGGQCHQESRPDLNFRVLNSEPMTNRIMSDAIQSLHDRKNLQLLNITYLTQMRKDGHSSVYYLGPGRGPASLHRQDCSHWCLPGVPDTWNQLIYGYLLARGYGARGYGEEDTRMNRR